MADLLQNPFFDDVQKRNWPKTGKSFTFFFGPPSQSIGRGRLSREGALDVRESRERRDNIFAEKTKKTPNFGSETAVYLNGEFSFFWPRKN